MSNLSLQASVRTCEVNTGWADRIQSDRFLNPDNMVCIPWGGFNSTGQSVCPDSFYTKTAGCNSALDRVAVENNLRPQYAEYITLNANGIDGDIYANNDNQQQALGRQKFDYERDTITGNFGTQWGANVKYDSCTVGAYERNMASMAEENRKKQFLNEGYHNNKFRSRAGM